MVARGNFGTRFLWLSNDVFAGTVVFLIALPLCLGIALASNAPIVAGLLSGVIGGILIGALSGSHVSVSGPAAGLTAIVAAQIATLGSFEAFLCAVVIAGFVQIILGCFRVGFIAAFFPTSVIKGLLFAIGFILILKQLPHLVGLDIDPEGEMAFLQQDHGNTFSALGEMFFYVHEGAILVGLLSLALIALFSKIPLLKKSKVPSPLVVVIVATSVSMLFPLASSFAIGQDHRVSVPVVLSFSDLRIFFTLPNFSKLFDPNVWFAGISLALVASLETLLNLEGVEKIDPQQRKSPPNRELVAQGVGNIVLGLIGGLPTTSVIVRSSVNINAGGRTKASTIIHGGLLVACVVGFPLLLNKIPLSCLAAILIATGCKLASPKIIKEMWQQGMAQFIPFVATFLAIVFTDLLVGVVIGLGISLLFILRRNLTGPISVIQEQHIDGEVNRVVLSNQVSFLNRAALKSALNDMAHGSRVLVDATDTDYIDADVLDLIKDFKNDIATVRNIQLSTIGFRETYAIESVHQFVDFTTKDLQKNATPEQVLQFLMNGNQRVHSGQRLRRNLNRQIAATSQGQFPLAVILSCIDSRVPVELIFDLGIGDVFSIRMAGNVISEKVLGSIEFACSVASAKLIVVLGHTKCGAISAAFKSHCEGELSDALPSNLGTILKDIRSVIATSRLDDVRRKQGLSVEACENAIIRENVQHSIEGIVMKSDVINDLLHRGTIGIVGCVYDVATGSADFIEPRIKVPNSVAIAKTKKSTTRQEELAI